MKVMVTHSHKLILSVFLMFVLVGCDQMEKVASGVGRATKSLSDKVSKGIISRDEKDDEITDDGTDSAAAGDAAGEAEDEVGNGTGAGTGDDSENGGDAKDNSDDADTNDDSDSTDDSNSTDDSGSTEDSNSDDSDSKGRNVEQYPRLTRSVTWKPISASSGDNLTIVLWGAGGGEKNYEEGSLRIEHNDGTKYPRTYVRRDDPDNGERAPKFYFDVQGSWFVGKDPVLFWNLGAYRVVNPEKRQGKHEGED